MPPADAHFIEVTHDDEGDLMESLRKRNRLLRERMKHNERLARQVLGRDVEKLLLHVGGSQP